MDLGDSIESVSRFLKNILNFSSAEIPQYRLSFEVVSFELQLMKDLGVQIEYKKPLGSALSLTSLRNDGYSAVFVGIGE